MCKSIAELDGQLFVCIADHKDRKHVYVHEWDAPSEFMTEWSHKIMSLANLFCILGITCVATAIVGAITLGR